MANKNILAYNDVDFSQLMIEEVKENEYSKYQLLSLPKYKYPNGVIAMLYMKTPMMNYTIGGFPPAKDKDGNELFKDEYERAKWRCYMGDTPEEQALYKKMIELQNKLTNDKESIIGKSNAKKFDLENIIGETTNKEGEAMYYIRFNFRTDMTSKNITTNFFESGNPDPISIKTVSEFESKYRRGTFRYRMIVSLNKIWRQKKLPGKYGASFKIEQMQIEMRDDITDMNGNINMKSMFMKSQFDDEDELVEKTSKMKVSKKEDVKEDVDEENDAEETSDVETSEKMKSKKVVKQEMEDEEEEDEDEEIKPTKKTAVKAKPIRKKANVSTA